MRPSIAVVIPAYNSERTIATTIRSVRDQTCSPEDIVVVDDGSRDCTGEVVRQFGKQVRLIRQENQGAGAARQTGTEATSAEYIAYLDADDWWLENKIQRCREILDLEDVDFMLTDFQRAHHDNTPQSYLPSNSTFYPWAKKFFSARSSYSGPPKTMYRLEKQDALTFFLQGFPPFPSTMIVKRTAIDTAGGWDSRFPRSQDFDFSLRMARKFPLHYLDEVLSIVGLHSGNNDCTAYVLKQTKGDISVLLSHLDKELAGSLYRFQVAQALGCKYRSLGYLMRKTKNYKQARKNYLKAMAYPGNRKHTFFRLLISCRP